MNKLTRVWNVFLSLIMILLALILIIDAEDGYRLIVFLVMIALSLKGLSLLVYYFTMARYAVGGIAVLYRGALLLDAGIFAMGLHHVPVIYTMIYLIICMLISGIIDCLRANEGRTLESGHWRLQMIYGAGNVVLAIVGMIFLHSFFVLAAIYALSLIHSAVCRLISTFRRSDIVYIGA